ncbi:MAG: DUF6105 family protein [Mesorhizobium sp.]|nr:DUF6105 family protein [Mesorhizobium sp.]
MRYLLIFWAAPMGFFWGWFFLSANDINFGSIYLSRALHELVFELYGQMLGMDPATIPWLVAKACVFDTLLIAGIFAFRRRAQLRVWFAGQRARHFPPRISAADAAGRAPLEG